MGKEKDQLPAAARKGDVDAFLERVATMPKVQGGARGRLIFALDATASRQPTWDRACAIQGEMFEVTAALGGLEIQLVFYRGFAECKASRWLSSAAELHRAMRAVSCLGGETQIERVLAHALKEAKTRRIGGLVFVGDAMEENIDRLCRLAGELGLIGVPVFVFHEGNDALAERAFRQVAQLSRGAYCRFDPSSPRQLRELLAAVAVYAAGGRPALEDYQRRTGGATLQLTHQLGKG